MNNNFFQFDNDPAILVLAAVVGIILLAAWWNHGLQGNFLDMIKHLFH